MADSGTSVFSGKKQRSYVGYEYKEIVSDEGMASLILDGYESFGWELDENLTGSGAGGRTGSISKTIIRLKRDRKIVNRAELTRLQRNFDACVAQIRTLEKRKTSAATVWALALGVIGTAFMAGSTFAVTAQPPHIVLCIILAIPGFLGWILPYFLYKRIQVKETEKIAPLIEAKYDEIYEICEKGNRLLY